MSAAPQFRQPLFRVKVCGLSRASDVDVATRAGADAIGVVHHAPSPRHLTLARAGAVLSRRPAGVRGVLVVVDLSPGDAERYARATGADVVQLCGAERPEDFVGFPLPILRRLPVDERAVEAQRRWSRVAAAFLLDHPAAPGGTGLGVDVALAALLCRAFRCVLAGGLDGDVVSQRVRETGAGAVDASSRLESTPGVKDPARVRAFVTAALAALNQTRTEPTR